MTIKIVMSELIAKCMQRMIEQEIDLQTRLKEEDNKYFPIRDLIIAELEILANSIEEQGVEKYFKIYRI